MYTKTLALVAALAGCAVANTDNDKVYKYVVAFSIDGMHGSDVEKYIAKRPKSTIASLISTAYEYTDCYIPMCSSLCVRRQPKNHWYLTLGHQLYTKLIKLGIWYDDVYDRSFWPPYSTTGKNCSGPPGAEGRIA